MFCAVVCCDVQGLVYPLDTVRTRLAVCSSSEYGSIWQTASKLWRKGGLPAFYRGIVPSMVSFGVGDHFWRPGSFGSTAILESMLSLVHARYSQQQLSQGPPKCTAGLTFLAGAAHCIQPHIAGVPLLLSYLAAVSTHRAVVWHPAVWWCGHLPVSAAELLLSCA